MCVTSAKNIWIQKLFLHVCYFLRFDRASVRFLFLELKKEHWEITKGIMSAHFLVIKKGLLKCGVLRQNPHVWSISDLDNLKT